MPRFRLTGWQDRGRRSKKEPALKQRTGSPHFASLSCSLSSLSLSSISHISSSVKVFFFLPSFSFFSRSLITFFASLAARVTFFCTSILCLPRRTLHQAPPQRHFCPPP